MRKLVFTVCKSKCHISSTENQSINQIVNQMIFISNIYCWNFLFGAKIVAKITIHLIFFHTVLVIENESGCNSVSGVFKSSLKCVLPNKATENVN